MARILITGGAGFIGSAVVRHVIDATQHEILNVDCLTYAGNLDSVAVVRDEERYSFSKTDICDRPALERLFFSYQPNAVLHLAAESHVDRSIDGPAEFVRTNVVGTYTLLDVARHYWQSLSKEGQAEFRFHHVSTDEVYGDLGNSSERFTEETAYDPSSPYSASKAGSDHLVRAWWRTYGMPILITNCSNNYGPYQFPEKLIPHITLNALQGNSLPIYGDGQQVRNWLHVEDHARALMLVLFEGRVGETYIVGDSADVTNLSVVETICALLEELAPERRSAEVRRYEDLIDFVPDRPGHDVRYSVDAGKLRKELGWQPVEAFHSGLRKTLQWYLENESWWQRVMSGAYRLERLGERN